MAAPRPLASSMILAADSTRSGSYRDLPTSYPAAFRKVLAMPPPTISLSTRLERLFRTSSLVETLEPPMMASSGCLGAWRIRVTASSSAAMSRPTQATLAKRMAPSVEACARCAVANASMTYTSPSAASLRATSSLFFFSPLLKRTFSHRTHSPGFTLTPSR